MTRPTVQPKGVKDKQLIIDQLLLQPVTNYAVLIDLMKRNIINRQGLDIMKDWVWNTPFIRYYDNKDLLDILEYVKKKGAL